MAQAIYKLASLKHSWVFSFLVNTMYILAHSNSVQALLCHLCVSDFDFGGFDVNLCRSLVAWKDVSYPLENIRICTACTRLLININL